MTEVHTPQSKCRFGIARRDITPPVGIYHRMWGAAAHDRSTDVHRPLTATAMVFQPNDADEKVVVVAVDHCLLFLPEIEMILDRVSLRTSVSRDSITLAFSHTHAAGLMDPQRTDLPGGDMIPPYLDKLADDIAVAVGEADAAIQAVTIMYASGRCSLAANRDFRDEENDLFVCGLNPLASADDTVLVSRVTDQNDQLIATIVNYACHPTTLAWGNTLISPDYPGAMREAVEDTTGALCVFLQGASGDIGPREGFVGDTDVADRNGRQLGLAALSTIESMPKANTKYKYRGPVISGATIGEWKHVSLDDNEQATKSNWQMRRQTVDLEYIDGLPNADEIESQFTQWQRDEQATREAGDETKAADARAMVERMRRWRTRLRGLPPGSHLPYQVTLWRIGDAIWLAVDGEPYNLLQSRLRERFPDTPIVVMVLANGSRAWYIPTAESYENDLYQVSMANVKAGSLEKLIDEIGDIIETIVSQPA